MYCLMSLFYMYDYDYYLGLLYVCYMKIVGQNVYLINYWYNPSIVNLLQLYYFFWIIFLFLIHNMYSYNNVTIILCCELISGVFFLDSSITQHIIYVISVYCELFIDISAICNFSNWRMLVAFVWSTEVIIEWYKCHQLGQTGGNTLSLN